MRLLIEKNDGAVVEVSEIEGINEATQVLILMCRSKLSINDMNRMEKELREMTGKQCVILGPEITRIVGV